MVKKLSPFGLLINNQMFLKCNEGNRMMKIRILICSGLIVMVACMPFFKKKPVTRTQELISIFEEKFKRVRKNADGKIQVQMDLSHRDGMYLEGDLPFARVTVNKRAHVRLLYITHSGEILQKFPPPEFSDDFTFEGFVSDLFEENRTHKIPEESDPFQYRVTLPEGVQHTEEIVIAMASSAPFTKIDSLLYEKQNRVSGGSGPGPARDSIINLSWFLFPQASALQWGPLVFDLFKSVFVDRRSGYNFGYSYKIITVTK